MTYPVHLEIDSMIPYYNEGKKNQARKEIQELMSKYEYDEDFVKNIDDNFCQGFGVARDIIFTFLKEEYWKKSKMESLNLQD